MLSGTTTIELRKILSDLETDEAAIRALLERSLPRLHALAGAILQRSFPRLGHRHSVDSIVGDVWIRLVQALKSARPATPADFFRLAGHKIRQALLDRAMELKNTAHGERGFEGDEALDRSNESGLLLLQWREVHGLAARLPADQRTVFELHYYLDLPESEIAKLLSLHPKKVSRLWLAATDRLAEWLGDYREGF